MFYEHSDREPGPYYNQSHLPVHEQTEAVGHAVRAVYMYTAMADTAAHTQDEGLFQACHQLWDNMVHKQMYITGGISSTSIGEAFSFDHDLPNDTIYADTCSSIGLIFFARRMLNLDVRSEYEDVMERALYNTVISGIALDGRHYFYVNPLEVWPKASERNPDKRHVKPVRQKWFGCACCPPNIAWLIASLGEYIYTQKENIAGHVKLSMEGQEVEIRQETDYPLTGTVKLRVMPVDEQRFTLALRIPGWCRGARLLVNGEVQPLDSGVLRNGYVMLDRVWKQGDTVTPDLPMEALWIQAHPEVRANTGRVAIQRGPFLYCLEEADNGSPLASLSLNVSAGLTETYDPDVQGGTVVLSGEAFIDNRDLWVGELYRPYVKSKKLARFTAIPYYLWGNRTAGEMAVWMRADD